MWKITFNWLSQTQKLICPQKERLKKFKLMPNKQVLKGFYLFDL